MTLAVIVPEAARRFGDRPAFVVDDGPTLTYTDLDRRSDVVAAALAARGIGDGDLVALTVASDLTYVIAYAAAAKVGAVTAGVNPRYTAAEQAADGAAECKNGRAHD
ncbi:MAG: AMP-binding protein [Acidimicrobiales bacterium]|nr:AMP-binding protein [Acidimicrobiales bacterium]